MQAENQNIFLPVRKATRLNGYDYSQNGCYFVTVCIKDKRPLLGAYKSKQEIQTAALQDRPQDAVQLTPLGLEVEKSIRFVDRQNASVSVQNAVVMPNHIHLLIVLYSDTNAPAGTDKHPTLQQVIGNLKSYTTKLYRDIGGETGGTLWQRSFYDRIIRNQTEFENAWNYITYNAFKEYGKREENPW